MSHHYNFSRTTALLTLHVAVYSVMQKVKATLVSDCKNTLMLVKPLICGTFLWQR